MNPFSKLLARLSKSPLGVPSVRQPQAFDAQGVADTIDRALTSAGLAQSGGALADVRTTIDTALARAGLQPAARAPVDGSGEPATPADGSASPSARAPAGSFTSGSFSNAAGTRGYKLYVPIRRPGSDPATPAPLLVMLHGCTQSPDDFAAGTRMNALADAHGFLVAYPAQTPRDNGSKCWNWFRGQDQRHGHGEPSLIAGIVDAIAAEHRIDPRCVFVAGLSAGAAMAVILGETYPDTFAAVGAHSGLPFGAAHDFASAFAAMQGKGAKASTKPASGDASRRPPVPTIVFHGTADHTVDPRNGAAIVQQATQSGLDDASLHTSTRTGSVAGGRHYSRDIFADADGHIVAEHWRIDGAGHAWSGGDASGSYTDPQGPDASSEMVRFFLQQSR